MSEWRARGRYVIDGTGAVQPHVAACEGDPETALANARLIAAAPCLLEALQLLLDEQNGPPLLRREAQWKDAVRKGYVAIRKAERGDHSEEGAP